MWTMKTTINKGSRCRYGVAVLVATAVSLGVVGGGASSAFATSVSESAEIDPEESSREKRAAQDPWMYLEDSEGVGTDACGQPTLDDEGREATTLFFERAGKVATISFKRMLRDLGPNNRSFDIVDTKVQDVQGNPVHDISVSTVPSTVEAPVRRSLGDGELFQGVLDEPSQIVTGKDLRKKNARLDGWYSRAVIEIRHESQAGTSSSSTVDDDRSAEFTVGGEISVFKVIKLKGAPLKIKGGLHSTSTQASTGSVTNVVSSRWSVETFITDTGVTLTKVLPA